MSDHIDDKELEELNEIYRRKMEAQKSHEPKKAKHDKPARDVKSENTHSEKSLNDKKTIISAKSEKPAKTEKQIKVKPEKQDKEEKAQQESKPLTDDERKKKLALRINIGVCTVFFAVVAIILLNNIKGSNPAAIKRNAQNKAASGSDPRKLLQNALNIS